MGPPRVVSVMVLRRLLSYSLPLSVRRTSSSSRIRLLPEPMLPFIVVE